MLSFWFFHAESKAYGHREGYKNGYEQSRDDTVLEMLGLTREDGKYLWAKVRVRFRADADRTSSAGTTFGPKLFSAPGLGAKRCHY